MNIIANMFGMHLLAVFFILGTVDQVEGEIVSVEITGLDQKPTQTSIHISFFPCTVKEGDVLWLKLPYGEFNIDSSADEIIPSLSIDS